MKPYIYFDQYKVTKKGTFTSSFLIPRNLKFVLKDVVIHYSTSNGIDPVVTISKISNQFKTTDKQPINTVCSLQPSPVYSGFNLKSARKGEQPLNTWGGDIFMGGDLIEIEIQNSFVDAVYQVAVFGEREEIL